MVTPILSLDKSLPGYLTVTDITTYTAGQRDLTGIMMFWSTDGFSSDFNVDQSNSAQWLITAKAQDTYNIYGFFGYTWDPLNDIDFDLGSIVYFDGLFYAHITDTTTNPHDADPDPAHDLVNWGSLMVGQDLTYSGVPYTPLVAADVYSFATSVGALASGAGVTQITFIDGDKFELSKTGCLKWEVKINISATLTKVELQNYDGTVLSDITSDMAGLNPLPIDLTAYGDGVYILNILYDTNVLSSSVQIPILEVCQANACYVKLFKKVLCECDDPCNDCGDKGHIHDMRMIRELITSINQMVNLEHSQSIGLYPITQDQSDFLSEIGQQVDKLKLITDRCGLCGGTV